MSKEDWNPDNKMKAAVAVFFRIFYVVLFLDKGDVVLFKKCVRKDVNVIKEGTDDPDSGNVVYIVFDVFNGNIKTVF